MINLTTISASLKNGVLMLLMLGASAIAMGQTKADELRVKLNDNIADTTRARLLNELGWEIRFTETRNAEAYANEALSIALKNKVLKTISKIYRTKALVCTITDRKIDAVTFYDSAIGYAKKAKDQILEASCVNSLGGMFGDFGDFDKAIEIYSQGLELATAIANNKLIATFYNNLADAYQNIGGKTEMVQKYYKLALANNLDNQNWSSACLNSANLASEYAAIGKHSEAIIELKQSIKLLKKTEYGSYLYGAANNEISTVYLKLGDNQLSLHHANISYHILDSLKMPNNVLHPLMNITNAEFNLRSLKNAWEHGNKLLKLATDKKAKIYIKEAYHSLSDIAKIEGKYEKALEFYQQFKRWDDSVFQVEREKNIASVEFKAALARQDLELQYGIKLKEKENQDLATDNRYLKRIIIFGVIAVFIFLILVLLLNRLAKREHKLNRELLEKNVIVEKQGAEKDVLIHEIHHRVKNNLTMLQSLFYLQSKSTSSMEIKQVLAESQTRLLSMSLVHQHLYENDNEGSLELVGFINNLLHDITETFTNADQKHVTYNVQGNNIEIGIKLAIPVGLLLNELITNSLKYAFPNKETGQIEVIVAELGKDLHIEYNDNGVGLPGKFNMNEAGFGFKILKLLSKQLKATITYNQDNGLSRFQLIIPKS